MQQGVGFTEVWHIMWFFAGTLIWYHTNKHTHTHKHTHSVASRLTYPYKKIFTSTISGVTESKPGQVRFRGFWVHKLDLKTGKFPTKWKKANVVPVYKKGDNKKILKNYRPVSLLPLCGNFFEKLMFNGMFKRSNFINPVRV